MELSFHFRLNCHLIPSIDTAEMTVWFLTNHRLGIFATNLDWVFLYDFVFVRLSLKTKISNTQVVKNYFRVRDLTSVVFCISTSQSP